MPDLAAWADFTKDREPKPNDDPFTKEFLTDKRNEKRRIWHYVDLPLGAQEYSRKLYPTLTNDEDVVQFSARRLHGDDFGPIGYENAARNAIW